jgi:CubicO group peptidase (beta-lactamase class C family)
MIRSTAPYHHKNFQRTFLLLLILLSGPGAFVPICLSQSVPKQPANFPGKDWKFADDPQKLGWSAAKLADAKAMAKEIGTHSFMLIDGSGVVITHFGDIAESINLMSIRKSLISALFGIYVDRKRFVLNRSLAELRVDDRPELTDAEKRATIRDLLMSRSGVYHKAAMETPGMIKNRPPRGSHAPGEQWYYNNWGFNALNTILEKELGRSTETLLVKEFVAPLGMQDFRVGSVYSVQDEGSIHPAVEIKMSTRDLARFGLLFLKQGKWHNRQLLSESWIQESTRPYSDLGILGGYGYSWWSALNGQHVPFINLPDGVYSARGTGEQILMILPHLNVVWVHRTKVINPDQEFMKVTVSSKLLKKILEAKLSQK